MSRKWKALHTLLFWMQATQTHIVSLGNSHKYDQYSNSVPEVIYIAAIYLLSCQTSGSYTIIVISVCFGIIKPSQGLLLDFFERLSMLCAKVPQPCSVPNWLCRQTWKNIIQYLTSITRFMEKNTSFELEKMRLDFPSDTGIKY